MSNTYVQYRNDKVITIKTIVHYVIYIGIVLMTNIKDLKCMTRIVKKISVTAKIESTYIIILYSAAVRALKFRERV